MPFDDLPDVFLPYQQRLWQAVDAHRVVVIEKSRRTGYSWALAAIASGHASTTRADGGSDVLYMGYEKEMTREFVDYVADLGQSQVQAAAGGGGRVHLHRSGCIPRRIVLRLPGAVCLRL